MTTKPFFHQQFYRAYLLLFFALILLASATFGLIKVREHNFQLQLNARLPQLEKSQSQLSLIQQAQQNLHHLATKKIATEFIEQHGELEKKLTLLAQQSDKFTLSDFPYLANKTEAQQIIRIAGKDSYNQQLLRQAGRDITQILTGFSQLLALKQSRADELYALIKNDTLSDRTTASRARAHAQLIVTLTQDGLADQQLTEIDVLLPLINLQSDEQLIEHLSRLSAKFFTWFEANNKSISTENQVLFRQLQQLQRLFAIDDRLVSKWRGHLRLYQDYQKLVQQQTEQLNLVLEQLSVSLKKADTQLSIDALLPNWLKQPLKQAGVSLSHQSVQLILFTVMALSLTMFFLVLLNVNRRIQISSLAHVKLVEGALQGEVKVNVVCAEQEKISAMLSSVLKPKYSEADVDLLIEQHQQMLRDLAKYHQVVSWQQQDISTAKSIKQLLTQVITLNHDISLRGNFTASSWTNLITSARQVKTTGAQAAIVLTTVTGEKLQCLLNYQGGFLGSLSLVHDTDNMLKTEQVEKTIQVLEQNKTQALEQQLGLARTLNDSVVKAMLQSQAECLTRKTPSSSLYRQLHRLLVWGQETELQSYITADKFQLKLTNTCLQTQILTCLANLAVETKGQKNNAQLLDKLPHLCHVQLDSQLFNAAMLMVLRVMLAGQRHSQLLLTTQLQDKNAGQYVVSYQFHLTAEGKLKNIPLVLANLLADQQVADELESPITRLLKALFQRLHANEFVIEQKDNGYQFTVNMPHALSQQQKEQKPVGNKAIDFTNKHFLYLADKLDDCVTQKVIEQALADGQASVTTAQNIKQTWPLLALEALKLSPIHVVILTERSYLLELTSHIAHLPEQYQPKIYLIEGSVKTASDNKVDELYSLLALPFDKYVFNQGIEQLLTESVTSNQVAVGQNLSLVDYQRTGIEVLMATSNFSQYSVLIKLLNVMGFNLTFVSNRDEMLSQWASGRHLILISEFATSPIIELRNGKQVQRGIIGCFAEDVAQWQTEAVDKHWQISCLPEQLTVKALSELLATWLVVKDKPVAIAPAPLAIPTRNNQALEAAIAFEDLPPAFDLKKFADNQAGSELAVMMMEEYVSENHQLAYKLDYAISVKSQEQINSHLSQLLINAKVMAAQGMLVACQQVQAAIEQQDYQTAKNLMIALHDEIELVAQYAEAI